LAGEGRNLGGNVEVEQPGMDFGARTIVLVEPHFETAHDEGRIAAVAPVEPSVQAVDRGTIQAPVHEPGQDPGRPPQEVLVGLVLRF